jgi:GNAT superfamily N-acetyltransferase
MKRAVEWARNAGCEGIELTSGMRPEREAAHRFYEDLGFQKTSYRFWRPIIDP